MGCCENIEKCILMYINGLYTIISLLCLFCGIWILCDYNWLEKLHLPNVPYLRELIGIAFIASGVLSAALYFAGLWGAVKEISSLLKVYSWILIIGLVSSVVELLMFYSMFDIQNLPYIEALFKNYEDEGAKVAVDFIQETFKCCGYNGPSDYQTVIFGGYPKSCCIASNDFCFTPSYDEGCMHRLTEVLTNWKLMAICTTAITAAIHIVCIIAAFRLASKIVKKNTSSPLYQKM